MSGIAGVYHLNHKPADPVALGRMLARLAHRGPDGENARTEGAVGLGHRMLWTTPESLHEQQPLVSRDGGLVVTADARIDNREDLIAVLGYRDSAPEEISDSALILGAYEKWGEDCPEHLLGDFAFALWDARQQRLFCARDAFGVKPFYYYHHAGQFFAFASEIKALFCLPEIPRRLNEVRVADYLASQSEDKAITFYANVLRLPPAHTLTVTPAGLRFREYWALDPSREIRYGSDEEYAEAFRDLFIEAVRCRLRSAFPVGFALSGGLDSSSIVSVAQKLTEQGDTPALHTFSCIFDDVPASDEREYVEAVLHAGKVDSHFVHPDRLGVLHGIDRMLWHQDQPLFIRNIFLWTAMNTAAREQGVRVMFDGEDGDSVVSHGWYYLSELVQAGEWDAFAREVKAPSMLEHFGTYEVTCERWLRQYGYPHLRSLAREGKWRAFARGTNKIAQHFDVPRPSIFLKHGVKPSIPEPVRRLKHRLAGRKNGQNDGDVPRWQDTTQLINPDFAQRVGYAGRHRALMKRYTPADTLRASQWMGLTGGLSSCILEEDDKAGAAFSLEKRHPFWDRRLVEFCLALPAGQRLHQGWPRWILRRAMEGILPDKVRWRVGKGNLGPNFIRSLFVLDREQLEDVILKETDAIAAYVDVPALRQMYQQALSNEGYLKGLSNRLWPALNLALWLRQTRLQP